MYIYLIKYFDEVIAAADGDTKADEVIQQYMRNNKDMKIDNFKKEAIRFFKEETMTEKNKDCVRLTEHDYDRCEDCYNYEFCKEESDEV